MPETYIVSHGTVTAADRYTAAGMAIAWAEAARRQRIRAASPDPRFPHYRSAERYLTFGDPLVLPSHGSDQSNAIRLLKVAHDRMFRDWRKATR